MIGSQASITQWSIAIVLSTMTSVSLAQRSSNVLAGVAPAASLASTPDPYGRRFDVAVSGTDMTPAERSSGDSSIGIFVPASFKDGATVDYVVFFHGINCNVAKAFNSFALEKQVYNSKVNAILIVPDQFNGLNQPGSFRRLISDVTLYLNRQGVLSTQEVGAIVLASHSAGAGIASDVLLRGGLLSHISDVLLFDSNYHPNKTWFSDYAAGSDDRRLVSIWANDQRMQYGVLKDHLSKHPNIKVQDLDERELQSLAQFNRRGALLIHTTADHGDVPKAHDYLTMTLETSKFRLSEHP